MPRAKQTATAVSGIANNNSGVIGAVNVNHVTKPIIEKYAEGTIGRNARLRNYTKYLQDRYYEFKKADLSFGADPVEHARIMNGLFPTMNNTIKKRFGAYPYGLEEIAFHSLEIYLKAKIDGTRLGKKNKSKGIRSYKTFEEFCEMAVAEK
jgi:hypothetical protein